MHFSIAIFVAADCAGNRCFDANDFKIHEAEYFPAPDTLSKLCMLLDVRADYIPGPTNEY